MKIAEWVCITVTPNAEVTGLSAEKDAARKSVSQQFACALTQNSPLN